MAHFVTFIIAETTCAVGIDSVESVLKNENLSQIPGAPDYVRGLLNLREEAVPVVDMRRKLGLEAVADLAASSIIVISDRRGAKQRFVGILVDKVCEVIDLSEEEIVPAEDFAVEFDREILIGVCKRAAGFVALIATDWLLDRDTEDRLAEDLAQTG